MRGLSNMMNDQAVVATWFCDSTLGRSPLLRGRDSEPGRFEGPLTRSWNFHEGFQWISSFELRFMATRAIRTRGWAQPLLWVFAGRRDPDRAISTAEGRTHILFSVGRRVTYLGFEREER